MSKQIAAPESLEINIHKSIDIDAPIDTVFETMLESLGPLNRTPDGEPMNLQLEPWPGGRWFRDLGNSTGHLWGHVQVIKPPNLLEITGPLFMSYPVASHVQWRLTEEDNQTRITHTHRALGAIQPDHAEGVEMGWTHMLELIRNHANN